MPHEGAYAHVRNGELRCFVNSTMGKSFTSWQEMFEDEKNPGGLKFLNPEDVTDMVLWLAESEAATKFNGREIVVDRGAML